MQFAGRLWSVKSDKALSNTKWLPTALCSFFRLLPVFQMNDNPCIISAFPKLTQICQKAAYLKNVHLWIDRILQLLRRKPELIRTAGALTLLSNFSFSIRQIVLQLWFTGKKNSVRLNEIFLCELNKRTVYHLIYQKRKHAHWQYRHHEQHGMTAQPPNPRFCIHQLIICSDSYFTIFNKFLKNTHRKSSVGVVTNHKHSPW